MTQETKKHYLLTQKLLQLWQQTTELLSQGQPVKLDGLGTFSPGIENNGGATSVDAALTQGADGMIFGSFYA